MSTLYSILYTMLHCICLCMPTMRARMWFYCFIPALLLAYDVFILLPKRTHFYVCLFLFLFLCPVHGILNRVCNGTWILISVIFHKISWYTLNYDNLQFHFITQHFPLSTDEKKMQNEFKYKHVNVCAMCMWICNFYWKSSAFRVRNTLKDWP